MNKILLCLMIMMIALVGVASVSASSDFNETTDIEEGVLDIDNALEDAVNESDIAANDTEADADSFEIDNETETVDNVTEDIDNVTEASVNDTEIEANNTVEPKPSPVSAEVKNEKKLPLRPFHTVEIPDVYVDAPKISTGDRIADAAVYYSAYYKAYQKAFPIMAFNLADSFIKPLEALIAVVYQSYNEKDTIDIVTKAYRIAYGDSLQQSEMETRNAIYKYFYEKMYYDEHYYYQYSGMNKKPGFTPGNPWEDSHPNQYPWDEKGPLQ